MPSPYSVLQVKSATLVGTAVDVITLTGVLLGNVEVWNRSGSADISFRMGAAGSVTDPTDKGDDCYVVSPGTSVTRSGRARSVTSGPTEVRIIGNGNAYTVSAD